jgi:hypothetical protein
MDQEASKKSKTAPPSSSSSTITTTTPLTITNPTTTTTLTCLPDAVHTYLSSFLVKDELIQMEDTSPKFREAYGGKRTALKLHWPESIPTSSKALFALLGRQERLEELTFDSISFFPSVLASISRGDCRYLRELVFKPKTHNGDGPVLEMSQIMPLAGLIAEAKLPELQRLSLDAKWGEGAIAVLADGLRNGARPKLKRLGRFDDLGVDTDASMKAVIELFETRHFPGCSRIRTFAWDDAWERRGSRENRERLLWALIPGLPPYSPT